MSKLIAVPRTELQESLVGARQRIKSKYPASLYDFIIKMEKLYEQCAYRQDFNELYRQLDGWIKLKAKKAYVKWRGEFRVSVNDFESLFWAKAEKVINDYTVTSLYFLMETLSTALSKAGIDLVRKMSRKKRVMDYRALPLKDNFDKTQEDESINVAETVVNTLFVEEILQLPSLTATQRSVLKTIYDNPDLSLRDVGRLNGIDHPEKVKRELMKVRKQVESIM